MGKGEIACNEQFLLFPQCFQKTCIADTKKPGLVWERVKILFHSLPNDKILDQSPFKEFTDDKIGATKKMKFVLRRVKTILGKRRKCWEPFQKFTLYHTIPTFNDPKEEGFGKQCGKRRKCC